MSVLELNGRVFDASTTGTLTLTGEGGAATTDVTQGLVKCWGHFEGSDATLDDSFNTSSLGDSGTGNFLVHFSNNMGNVNYHADANGNISLADAANGLAAVLNPATANMGLFTAGSGALIDSNDTSYSNCGDLA